MAIVIERHLKASRAATRRHADRGVFCDSFSAHLASFADIRRGQYQKMRDVFLSGQVESATLSIYFRIYHAMQISGMIKSDGGQAFWREESSAEHRNVYCF
ncbi:MAG: hypothetical protein LBC26_04280 [Oscillospiraceae bacterium]|nr:hypothetical protein [Oscillospiraceae bacterium]